MFVNKGSDQQTIEFIHKAMNYGSNDEIRTIKLSGDSKTLDKLEKMLAYMQWLGDIRHSTGFKVDVDGDGAFRVDCKGKNNVSLVKKWKDEVSNGQDIELFSFE